MKAKTQAFEDVYAQLEGLGSEKFRAIYARQGAPANQFGVMRGPLRALAKAIKTDHALGLKLWASGNADAMILGTMVMAPEQLSAPLVRKMVEPLTWFTLVDELTYNAVAKSPCADELRKPWMKSAAELTGRAGWNLTVARLMAKDVDGLDLDALLKDIEAHMKAAPVRKMESMCRALVEIGVRHPELRGRSIAIGEKLGRIDDRPVPKGCLPFYAPDWIAAVLKRKK